MGYGSEQLRLAVVTSLIRSVCAARELVAERHEAELCDESATVRYLLVHIVTNYLRDLAPLLHPYRWAQAQVQ